MCWGVVVEELLFFAGSGDVFPSLPGSPGLLSDSLTTAGFLDVDVLVLLFVLLLLVLPVWVLTCLLRWSLRINLLLHVGQANRFSPVCVRRWRCNSSDRVNRFPQNNQLQTKGRSPVCHLRWAFRWDVFPYTLPHPGMWQLWVFFFMCRLTCCSEPLVLLTVGTVTCRTAGISSVCPRRQR